jgi:hypothetical protein
MMTNLVVRWMGIAAFAAALLVGPAARAAEPVGAVAALEGSADVLREGGAWTPLAAGDQIMLGDRVRTAAASKIKILFRDESVMTLAASSEMTVDQQVAAAAPVSRFSLLVGAVRAIVTEAYGTSGASFELETPTAIAGVRGTGFIASYDPAASETVVVGLFDTTVVRAREDKRGARAVNVVAGQATSVRRGSFPTVPAPMADERFRNLTEGTNLAGGGGAERGLGRGKGGEGKVPRTGGQKALSPEERVIDQPPQVYQRGPGGGKPPPPPPPPPRAP